MINDRGELSSILNKFDKDSIQIGSYERHWLELAGNCATIIDTATEIESVNKRGIFLAHAFSSLRDQDGLINSESRQKIEALLKALREQDLSVHCALEREKWGG